VRVNSALGCSKGEGAARGVKLAEVDASTRESRVASGCWLCVEDFGRRGRLGGFNFQWSWSPGAVAGRAAASTASPIAG
jgi:predicted flavoprotein YhiN